MKAKPSRGSNGALAKPAEGEVTAAQNLRGGMIFGGGSNGLAGGLPFGLIGGALASGENPWGWQRRDAGNLYLPTPWTYEWMLRHPKVAHAMENAIGPASDARWEIGYPKGMTPDSKILDYINGCHVPQRNEIYGNSAWGVAMARAPYELVWQIKDGLYWLRLKPLKVEATWPLEDAYGNFEGLAAFVLDPTTTMSAQTRPTSTQIQEGLAANKSWQFVYGARAGSLWGRSRFENFRETAWKQWLDAATQLYRMGDKLSGTIVVIRAPAGLFPDGKGGTVNYIDECTKAGKELKKGNSVVLPSLAGLIKVGMSPADVVKLLEASSTNLEVLDFGNISPAIAGQLSVMQHYEGLMDEGMLLSPRVGREAQKGTGGGRADVEQQTSTGIGTTQRYCISHDMQYSKGPLNISLELNFGPQVRDQYWLYTPPLEDQTAQASRTFISMLAQSNKDLAGRIGNFIDMDQTAADGDLKTAQKWSATPVPQSESDLPVVTDATGATNSADPTAKPPRRQRVLDQAKAPKEPAAS